MSLVCHFIYYLFLFVFFLPFSISVRLRVELELSAGKLNAWTRIRCHHKTAKKKIDLCFDRLAMSEQLATKVCDLKLVSPVLRYLSLQGIELFMPLL